MRANTMYETVGTTFEQAPRGLGRGSGPSKSIEGRRIVPAKWWAAIGTGFIALMVYAMTAWIISGHAVPTQ